LLVCSELIWIFAPYLQPEGACYRSYSHHGDVPGISVQLAFGNLLDHYPSLLACIQLIYFFGEGGGGVVDCTCRYNGLDLLAEVIIMVYQCSSYILD
jgi:hypothetical protein